MGRNTIDTHKMASHLRDKGIIKEQGKILITRFDNTDQESDLTLPPNCGGFGRIHHFKRFDNGDFPPNSLPIDPALNYLKLEFQDELRVQVFQNAFCSWRCWYCFVDYKLLSANQRYSEFKTADELLDLYLQEPNRPPIIDLSGGQPDVVPEWSLWMADAIHRRGLQGEVYLWSDDNLSNDYLWTCLSPEELKRLVSYGNYARVGCFKGFDEESFSFNTTADRALWSNQFKTMRKLVKSGFDMYGYVTLTGPNSKNISNKVRAFIDKMQEEVHPVFPLRTVPLKILKYTPTMHRMSDEHYYSLEVQCEAIAVWKEELAKRFTVNERQMRVYEHKLEY